MRCAHDAARRIVRRGCQCRQDPNGPMTAFLVRDARRGPVENARRRCPYSAIREVSAAPAPASICACAWSSRLIPRTSPGASWMAIPASVIARSSSPAHSSSSASCSRSSTSVGWRAAIGLKRVSASPGRRRRSNAVRTRTRVSDHHSRSKPDHPLACPCPTAQAPDRTGMDPPKRSRYGEEPVATWPILANPLGEPPIRRIQPSQARFTG